MVQSFIKVEESITGKHISCGMDSCDASVCSDGYTTGDTVGFLIHLPKQREPSKSMIGCPTKTDFVCDVDFGTSIPKLFRFMSLWF